MNGKQLKNSILQWAIQGKLVPQDPNDEPASVLLKKIRQEKERLIKEKKIKRDKNASIIYRGEDNSYYEKILATGEVKCIDDELPYSLPLGWTWCRLNELGIYRKGPFGSSLTKSMFVSKSEHSIKVYEQKNAIQKDYRLGDYYISEDKFSEMQSFVTKPSDIIVSCAGTIGETYLLPEEAPIGIINQALMRVELYNLDIADYWQLFFAYILLIENEMKGAGSAIKNIPPFEFLKAILVPIPPLQEQKRITEKYNELTKLICQYTQQKELLDLLNDNLYSNIKKSILQEAIQGKLVPQDPNDESASVLLEKIRAEKAMLVREGKLKKKDLVESTIFRGDDNKYYEQVDGDPLQIEADYTFPETWGVVRLAHICRLIDGEKKEGDYVCLDAKYLRGKSSGDILPKGKFVSKGDNIILVDGENSGEVFAVPHDGYMGSTFKQLWVSGNMHLPYVLYFIQFYKDLLRNSKKGAAIPHLNKEIFYSLVVGIPPYQEQERIVKRIDNIFNRIKGD